jgi:pimeloyl-ACP methyl ester carboxylesterase
MPGTYGGQAKRFHCSEPLRTALSPWHCA